MTLTLDYHATSWADMVPHLATLTALAREADRAVEFGVRGGVSTWALLDGLPVDGTLLSIDIDPCHWKIPDRVRHDPRWTFVVGDDRDVPLPARADLVVIDTSHEYGHTLVELRRTTAMSPAVIALHDYNLPDVERAVQEFIADPVHEPGRWELAVEPSSWGLAVLRWFPS